MAEWSKAPANSPREQGGVGSKPAPAKKLVFALFLSFFDHSDLVITDNKCCTYNNVVVIIKLEKCVVIMVKFQSIQHDCVSEVR